MHAVAIRLRDDGVGDHVIAVALAIDVDEVPTLLQIAESKLSNLMALDAISSPGANCIDRPRPTHANDYARERGFQ